MKASSQVFLFTMLIILQCSVFAETTQLERFEFVQQAMTERTWWVNSEILESTEIVNLIYQKLRPELETILEVEAAETILRLPGTVVRREIEAAVDVRKHLEPTPTLRPVEELHPAPTPTVQRR